MLIIYFRILLLLIFCGIGAYTDHKTGYIYDKVTLPLIVLGLLLNIFAFSFVENVSILITAAIIFIGGFVLYYFGKLGGGDIKLFLGIHLMLPYLNNQLFILWVLLLSCLLAVVFISIKYTFLIFKKIKITKKLLLSKISSIVTSFCLFFSFVILLYYSVNYSNLSSLFYLSLIPISLGLFINIFQKEIKKHIYLLWKDVSLLEDGDVIAKEFLSKSLLNKLKPIMKKRIVLEQKDIETIQKKKLPKIPIYYYLPKFGPYIFLGIVCSVIILI
jgi:Flp pilus assembly protein protease CpaA